MINCGNKERGAVLVVSVLIMAVMLAAVLGLAVLFSSQIKIAGEIGDATVSFYAAQSGAEEVLFFDKKQIPFGASRGFCNICNICGETGECANCQAVSLAAPEENGCDVIACSNCRIVYESSVAGDKEYIIDARLTPSAFNIRAKGFYRNAARAIEINANP